MSKDTIIEFHSGLDTIGGNIVSLTYGNYRIISDFGALAGSDYLELLDITRLEEFYDAKKLPQIEGIYRQEYLKDLSQVLAYESSPLDTIVLISHLHIDHVGSLSQLHPSIPVYLTEEALKLYQLLIKEDFLPNYPVNWQEVKAGEEIEHGPFKVQFHLSDHDTHGAAAIFMQSPDLKLIYSGDIRLTGFQPQQVLEMLIKAREFQADILLLEGTSYSHVNTEMTPLELELEPLIEVLPTPTEAALMKEVDQLLKDNPNKVFAFNGYPQNIQRVVELAETLDEHGRTLVLQENLYNLMAPYLGHLENFKRFDKASDIAQIQHNPGNYLLQVDEFTYEEVFDLPAGIFLHSNGVPLGPFMPLYETYVKAFAANKWRFMNADVSGHASNHDLLTIANMIQADITIPWHSFKPLEYSQALEAYGLRSFLPQYHQQYTLETIQAEVKQNV